VIWVANDRPAIAAVALGRTAPTTGSIDAALPRERDYQRGAYGHGGFTPLEISHRPLMK